MSASLPQAAQAFDEVAGPHERARPGYPSAALDHLVDVVGLDGTGTVVDVAAGTGKLTRDLVAHARHVVAVEPLPAMRAVLRREVPAARVIAGVAEALPLRSGSARALTVAAALHWFDPALALPEIHRVLAAGAAVAVLRNRRDETTALQRALGEPLAPLRAEPPNDHGLDVAGTLTQSGLSDRLNAAPTRNHQWLDEASFAARVASIGFVAMQPPDVRGSVGERAASSSRSTLVRTEASRSATWRRW
ncbi:MAG: class I SAM-dependent methyltransferase [Nitriliruptorales bacterium]